MASTKNPVNWFEIPATDLARARKFYEVVFGCELTTAEIGPCRMAWFPMNNEIGGSSGSLVQGEGYIPAKTGTVVYFTVDDIPAALARIVANGGTELQAKTGIGEYGFIARFGDTEGNVVALHSFK